MNCLELVTAYASKTGVLISNRKNTSVHLGKILINKNSLIMIFNSWNINHFPPSSPMSDYESVDEKSLSYAISRITTKIEFGGGGFRVLESENL